jgi:hypothetical protein
MGGDGLGSFSSRFIQRLGTVTGSPNPEACFVTRLDPSSFPGKWKPASCQARDPSLLDGPARDLTGAAGLLCQSKPGSELWPEWALDPRGSASCCLQFRSDSLTRHHPLC